MRMIESKMHRKHKGARNELAAIVWLMDMGYEVFRNVSPYGPVDLVAIKDGATLLLDVKTAGCNPTDEQLAKGIVFLVIRGAGFMFKTPTKALTPQEAQLFNPKYYLRSVR